jgi:hypothetical protein
MSMLFGNEERAKKSIERMSLDFKVEVVNVAGRNMQLVEVTHDPSAEDTNDAARDSVSPIKVMCRRFSYALLSKLFKQDLSKKAVQQRNLTFVTKTVRIGGRDMQVVEVEDPFDSDGLVSLDSDEQSFPSR